MNYVGRLDRIKIKSKEEKIKELEEFLFDEKELLEEMKKELQS